MKKYFIRAGKTPMENFPNDAYLQQNIIGSNSDNLLYQYSVMRTLMTDSETTFETTRYHFRFSAQDIERINKECTAFIIPLADAFRESFMRELDGLTNIVKKLTIPSIVIGVGISAKPAEKIQRGESTGFDDHVVDFVRAVLEKSGCLGLRGVQTAEYLTSLGFVEGRDFRVIGCPSLYMFGKILKIRDVRLTSDIAVMYNTTKFAKPSTIAFIDRASREFTNATLVPQLIDELKTLYLGLNYDDNDFPAEYPHSVNYSVYTTNNVRFFVSVPEWLSFASKCDFAFGSRSHGCTSAILAGTPALYITKDSRMRELCEFHGLPYIDEDDLSQYRDIFEAAAAVDFHFPEKKQARNFQNYLDFLHDNGLETIYDNDPNRMSAPLDDLMKNVTEEDSFSSILCCKTDEILRRNSAYIHYLEGQRNALRAQARKAEELKVAQERIKKLERENAAYQEMFSSKTV